MATAPAAQPPPGEVLPLLTLRAALIFTLAILIGVGAGVLTVLAGSSLPQAVLVGTGVGGSALMALNKVIGS